MAKIGRMSSSQKTRNINIQFFFIKYRIDNRELAVKDCPTGGMIADFFTKSLQCAKFIDFRDIIMGTEANHYRSQERVGTCII